MALPHLLNGLRSGLPHAPTRRLTPLVEIVCGRRPDLDDDAANPGHSGLPRYLVCVSTASQGQLALRALAPTQPVEFRCRIHSEGRPLALRVSRLTLRGRGVAWAANRLLVGETGSTVAQSPADAGVSSGLLPSCARAVDRCWARLCVPGREEPGPCACFGRVTVELHDELATVGVAELNRDVPRSDASFQQ